MRHHLATGEIKRIQPLPGRARTTTASTGTARSTCRPTTRARSTSGASISSARATAASRGRRSRPISPPTIPSASGRCSRAACPSTTPPPRTTPPSTRSASRRRTARSSGWAPTTAWCRSPATAAAAGPTSPPTSRICRRGCGCRTSTPARTTRRRRCVTVDGHRSGDMATYVYRTTDFGDSWTSLAGDDIEGFARVAVQDPVNPELLFLGTEFGLYISLDGGAGWARFTGDLPKVPVHDLDIHPREHDLIVGTHGRGIYILDDLTPLRALTQEVVDSKFALLPSRDAVMVLNSPTFGFGGDDEFVGRNPPAAASIVYYQSRRHIFGDLKVEVYRRRRRADHHPAGRQAQGDEPGRLADAAEGAKAAAGHRAGPGLRRAAGARGHLHLQGEEGQGDLRGHRLAGQGPALDPLGRGPRLAAEAGARALRPARAADLHRRRGHRPARPGAGPGRGDGRAQPGGAAAHRLRRRARGVPLGAGRRPARPDRSRATRSCARSWPTSTAR